MTQDERRKKLAEVLKSASERVNKKPEYLRSDDTRNQIQALRSPSTATSGVVTSDTGSSKNKSGQ